MVCHVPLAASASPMLLMLTRPKAPLFVVDSPSPGSVTFTSRIGLVCASSLTPPPSSAQDSGHQGPFVCAESDDSNAAHVRTRRGSYDLIATQSSTRLVSTLWRANIYLWSPINLAFRVSQRFVRGFTHRVRLIPLRRSRTTFSKKSTTHITSTRGTAVHE